MAVLQGGLVAAGITYASGHWESTWAWRMPSAFQSIFALLSIFVLPFIPESPHWLVYNGRHQEALEVIATTHADGNLEDPTVVLRFKEITDTLEWEKNGGQTTSLKGVVKTKSNMRRIILVISDDTFAISLRTRLVSIAALLRRYSPSPHPLLRLLSHVPALPPSN
jgi:hypothetical protein